MFGFGTIFTILFIINLVFSIIVIINEKHNPQAALAWLGVLLFVPLLGFILYIFFGKKLSKKKIVDIKGYKSEIYRIVDQEKLLDNHRMIFYDWAAYENQTMIKLLLSNANAVFTQDNYVEIFTDGKLKFKKLFEEIEKAENHIHLLYFAIKDDALGKKLIDILCKKAEQGVIVRVLYDGLTGSTLHREFFKPLFAVGGEAACFYPALFSYFKYININHKVNNRNHRKIAIIDGKTGFIGGFNISEKYLGLDKKFGYWRDTHLMIRGSAVNYLQNIFILDWNIASKKKIDNAESFYYDSKDLYGKTGMQIVSCGPDSDWEQIKYGYLKMINDAKKSIYIHTPYFVPDDTILDSLKIAAISGLDVRIMIPNKPDHIFVYWATYSYIGELLNIGAKIYIYEKGFLHSKMVVTDGIIASVGTANMDNRSFKLNFEVNAFIYDHIIAQKLEDIFISDIKDCRELTLEIYNNRSFIIKIKESISRLLAPIL